MAIKTSHEWRTFEMKHCFTTKSRISHGPSEHQQNRTRGAPVYSSMRPLRVRNSWNVVCNNVANVGAASTSSYKGMGMKWYSRGLEGIYKLVLRQ